MPEKTARGGINACEPPFLRALEVLGVEILQETYTYDNDERVSIFQRIAKVWRTGWKFRRILRNGDFDVAHLNSAFDRRAVLRDAFSLLIAGRGHTKFFVKFHGSDVEFLESANVFQRAVIRFLVERADAIGLLSTEELNAFTAFGFPPEKFFVVMNAVTNASAETFPHVEKASGDDRFRLLFVSRLIPAKGLADTVRACAILRKRGFNVTLDVLGDGDALEPAERLAGSLGITGFVTFRGHVDEETVQKFYLDSDLLVFPTFHCEGFPMVIFNAMRCGLPIVTTKIRAAADLLKDRENCLFCEPKNPEDIAAKIEELIGDAELRERMGDFNEKLAGSFSADKIAPHYLEIYRGLSERK